MEAVLSIELADREALAARCRSLGKHAELSWGLLTGLRMLASIPDGDGVA